MEQRDCNTSLALLRSQAAFFKQALREAYAEVPPAVAPVKNRPMVNVQPIESPEEVQVRLDSAAVKEEI